MRLVITGAPNSGTTTLSHVLECQFARQVTAIPDPMDLINIQLIPLCKNKQAQKCRQKAFYYLQKEIEDLYAYNNKTKLFICDRGSLDVLGNWPDTPKSFFHEIHSSVRTELKRYDWIIGLKNNTDDLDPQSEMLRDPQSFWAQHPNYISVSTDSGFSACAAMVAKIVEKILDGHAFQEVISMLHKIPSKNIDTICKTHPNHHEGTPLI